MNRLLFFSFLQKTKKKRTGVFSSAPIFAKRFAVFNDVLSCRTSKHFRPRISFKIIIKKGSNVGIVFGPNKDGKTFARS